MKEDIQFGCKCMFAVIGSSPSPLFVANVCALWFVCCMLAPEEKECIHVAYKIVVPRWAWKCPVCDHETCS